MDFLVGPIEQALEPAFLAAEQESQLAQIAAHEGTDTTQLVKTAALRLVETIRSSAPPAAVGSPRPTGESRAYGS